MEKTNGTDDDLRALLALGADGSGAGAFCLSLEADAVYYWSFIESERREVASDLGSSGTDG